MKKEKLLNEKYLLLTFFFKVVEWITWLLIIDCEGVNKTKQTNKNIVYEKRIPNCIRWSNHKCFSFFLQCLGNW